MNNVYSRKRTRELTESLLFLGGGRSLFYKGKNPLQEGATFKTPNHFPKSPPPNTITYGIQIRSDQSLSCVWLFATPWIVARQASLSITNSGVHWDSRPSSQWCHPAISSSVVPFSSCPQSLPYGIRFQQMHFGGTNIQCISFITHLTDEETEVWSVIFSGYSISNLNLHLDVWPWSLCV